MSELAKQERKALQDFKKKSLAKTAKRRKSTEISRLWAERNLAKEQNSKDDKPKRQKIMAKKKPLVEVPRESIRSEKPFRVNKGPPPRRHSLPLGTLQYRHREPRCDRPFWGNDEEDFNKFDEWERREKAEPKRSKILASVTNQKAQSKAQKPKK